MGVRDWDGGVILVLIVSSIVFAIGASVYLFFLRKKFPHVYYPKRITDPLYQSTIGWVKDVVEASDERVLESGGFLALMYVRFEFYALLYVAVVSVFSVCVFMPFYIAFAALEDEVDLSERGFTATTAMSIESGSGWLWVPVLGVMLSSVLAYYFLLHFQSMFLVARDRYKSIDEDGVNYHTVKVQRLPDSVKRGAELE